MNYYEELGLDNSATNDEIRIVYKRLTRLLHPDQQQDPLLRELAERQMKRLNHIHETLTDPDKRRAYDLSLAWADTVIQHPPATDSTVHVRVTSTLEDSILSGRFLKSGWTWVIGAVCVMIVMAAWFPTESAAPELRNRKPGPAVSDKKDSGPTRAPRPVAPAALPVQPAPIAAIPVRGGTPGVRAKVASPRTSPAVSAPAVAPPAAEPEVARLSALSDQRQPDEPARRVERSAQPATPPPLSRQAAFNSLSGNWLSSGENDKADDTTQYAARYVELSLTEREGKLRGLYKASYVVSDQAISPHVAFQFEGAEDAKEFLWRGKGGAAGRIRLERVSANTLEINWYATEMGKELGLGSGSATLYRRRGE